MGTFVLALHSHLPYCRGAGRWPHGEEWIHEAVLGTYLPLLVLLHDLRDAGVPYRIVIGLTPILIEQLADRDIIVRTLEYIDDQVLRAEQDVRRFSESPGQGRAELANFYVGSYRRLREAYRTLSAESRPRVRRPREDRTRRDPDVSRDPRLSAAPRCGHRSRRSSASAVARRAD